MKSGVKSRMQVWQPWLAATLLGIMVFLLTGCASTEPDNASSRPWNTPRNWEHGLPSGLYEGR